MGTETQRIDIASNVRRLRKETVKVFGPPVRAG